jgi:hypothetical protein
MHLVCGALLPPYAIVFITSLSGENGWVISKRHGSYRSERVCPLVNLEGPLKIKTVLLHNLPSH